jgi:hypothetical protein
MSVENEDLKKEVEKTSPLKEWVVNYIGTKLSPEDKNVTLEMALEVFAEEFPEFVLALAEENFIRGYQQAFNDIQSMAAQRQEESKQDEQPSA